MKILTEESYSNLIDFIDVACEKWLINLVIKEVYDSGMKSRKYLKHMSNSNFITLTGLLADVR